MPSRATYSRMFMILGLTAMILGAIDPLEGSMVILPGVAIGAVGALIGKSRFLPALCWSLALIGFGVAAMFVLSWLGGLGGSRGHSLWWGLLLLPYPIGWLLGILGSALALTEPWRKPQANRPSAV